MTALFADIPEAVANTAVIAQRCAFKVNEVKPILPRSPKNYPNMIHAGCYSATLHYLKAAADMGAAEAKKDGAATVARMKKMHAYIAVRGADNIFETSDIPGSQAKLVGEIMRPVMDWRVNKTKWVVLRWPTSSMAQQAKMSTEAFTDFYFRVCTLDYARMKPGMAALKALMEKTDRVRLVAPGTAAHPSCVGA